MKKQIFYLSVMVLAFLSCSNNKQQQQTLEDTAPEKREAVAKQEPVILSVDNVERGEKKPESRDRSGTVEKLDFTKHVQVELIDLGQYFKEVSFLKLKHPDPLEGDEGYFFYMSKFYGKRLGFPFQPRTNDFINPCWDLNVYFSADQILVKNAFAGLYSYDMEGNFRKKITSMAEVEYVMDKNFLLNVSVVDNTCLYVTINDKKTFVSFYDLASQQLIYRQEVSVNLPYLLSGKKKEYVDYYYNVTDTEANPFMSSHNMVGDTLCEFMNFNPLVTKKVTSSYHDPEDIAVYYFQDQLMLKQSYNDTIFRMKSPSVLQPVYVLAFGDEKLEAANAPSGNKAGKYILDKLFENEKFIWMVHADNVDSPNNRMNSSVGFIYSIYDKAEKQIKSVITSEIPENFFIQNSLPGAIPLSNNFMWGTEDILYAYYTKDQLNTMITKGVGFASLPEAQQLAMQTYRDEMTEGELLIMILK